MLEENSSSAQTEFKERSKGVQKIFKNNSEKYEYLIKNNPNDKWIENFCPAPSNDPSCHRTRACCYYRCEGAAIPKKLLHDPS